MTGLVVHRKRAPFDVYIGRPPGDANLHYGNPFSDKPGNKADVRVASRDEAVARFASWLDGTTDHDVNPERRAWILDHLPELRGKVLGCWCAPQACHGDVLARLANEPLDAV